MKKFVIFVFSLFFIINTANANPSAIKNFYAYEIKGHNIREVSPIVENLINNVGDINNHKIQTVPNAWYYTQPKTGETYYFRLYPANKNTNVFIVGNEEYDKKNNDMTTFFKSQGYKYDTVSDDEAIREYKFDFYDLARKDQLGGFFIAPDCIKPLKSGMKKINDTFAQNSKKNAVIPYSEDNNPIDLTLVDSISGQSDEIGISVIENEYRLKQKGNKYVHAFEYKITNQKSTPIVMEKATCERLASTKDIATEAYVDLDRLDLLDSVSTFPPVLVCTCGTSIVCSVPNWVRLAKTTAEATRYAKSLPENYTIQSGKTLRILVLKYKNNIKPINFKFNRNGIGYDFSL